MRPKKKILLVSESDIRLSEYRFLLMMHGYKVFASEALSTALNAVVVDQPDAILVLLPFAKADELIRRTRGTITVAIANDPEELPTFVCDAVLGAKVPAAELLERLKIWTARKRGPKKGSKLVPSESEAACAIA